MKSYKASEVQMEEAKDAYQKGVPVSDIARVCGVSTASVYSWAQTNGWVRGEVIAGLRAEIEAEIVNSAEYQKGEEIKTGVEAAILEGADAVKDMKVRVRSYLRILDDEEKEYRKAIKDKQNPPARKDRMSWQKHLFLMGTLLHDHMRKLLQLDDGQGQTLTVYDYSLGDN